MPVPALASSVCEKRARQTLSLVPNRTVIALPILLIWGGLGICKLDIAGPADKQDIEWCSCAQNAGHLAEVANLTLC